jgi:hypothetical protein
MVEEPLDSKHHIRASAPDGITPDMPPPPAGGTGSPRATGHGESGPEDGGLGPLVAVCYDYPLGGGAWGEFLFASCFVCSGLGVFTIFLVIIAPQWADPNGAIILILCFGSVVTVLAVHFGGRGELRIHTDGVVKRTCFSSRTLRDEDIAVFSFTQCDVPNTWLGITEDTILRIKLWPKVGQKLKPIRFRTWTLAGPLVPHNINALRDLSRRLARKGLEKIV